MEVKDVAERLVANVERVIVGKHQVVELTVVSLLAQGHVLIEDVPGVGKTMLARALAKSLGCMFRRIQFTPDMLPSDVTGVSIFNQKTREFEFRPGPIMAQIVLTDEINRATPKTQAALLEAMQELQVTVDGVTYELPTPFLVLATQNPIEYEGTFPLPEAQLDRFLLKLSLGYLDMAGEGQMLQHLRGRHPIDALTPVVEGGVIPRLAETIWGVHVDDTVRDYIVRLVHRTRHHPALLLGASPRGSLALYRGAQALAALRGRSYVLPDDVKELAPFALAHRCIVSPESALKGQTAERILSAILDEVELEIGDV